MFASSQIISGSKLVPGILPLIISQEKLMQLMIFRMSETCIRWSNWAYNWIWM